MNNFLIYRSSAGSGKTYTLVKEYLKLVLNGAETDSFRNVLAVTFTNKSASEMKQRIISALVKLSGGEDDDLKNKLIAEGVKGNIELISKQVLQNILHKYSYFSVSTIDSFFHKVIRSFAKELKLQLGYNIELDQHEVLNKITDKLLDDTGVDDELTKFIEAYIYYSIDDEKGWNIDLKIKDIAREIFTERYWIKTGIGNDLLESRAKLNEFIGMLFAIKNEFESRMKLIAEDAAKLLKHYRLTMEDFPFKKAGFMNYLINKIVKGDFEPGVRARDAAGDIKKFSNKSTPPEVMKAAEGGLFDLLNSAVDNYDKNFIRYNSAVQLIKTIYITGIFKDLLEKLKQYRDENKLLMISDVNNLLLSVISGESSPFVYEKIGTYYKNFLIDEFQDTSTFQWRNFKPLIENSLSENNASIIVGDVKQSIYRWRNGNMKLLLEEVQLDLALFSTEIKEETLNKNFRSKKEIIEFNNHFFKKASELSAEHAPEGTGSVILKAYNEAAQIPSRNDEGGYVNVSFYRNDKEAEVSSREIAIQSAIREMKALLKAGYRQKDIMVLVRNNSGAMEAAHAIIDARLKVISSDSLLLTNSPKVRLLINLFKYITDKNNVIARTEVLYNYLIYIKNENIPLNVIFTDHLKSSDSLFSKLMAGKLFKDKKSGEQGNYLFALSLYDLTEELIKIFELGDTTDSYLLRFLDVVMEYSQKYNTGTYGFLSWWEENKQSSTIIVHEEEDAIRVMTIHKAKGLQAPVVFIPFANWDLDLNANRDMIWVSSDKVPFNASPAFFVKATSSLSNSYFAEDYKEEAMLANLDNLNMMYVAFTRAEERLYISIPQKGRTNYHTGELIYNTLTAAPELDEKFNRENYCFETGQSEVSKDQEIIYAESKTYKTNGIISGDVYGKIIIKPEYENFAPEKKNNLSHQKNRGLILHNALSLLNTAGKDDIDIAVNKMIISGLLTADQEEKLKEELNKILSIGKVKSWFKAQNTVMNERDIIMPGGNMYRPDRVIIDDQSTVVVDYKTGGKMKDHKEQIKMYGEILGKMGFKNVKMNLLYINELQIEEVN